jgi:zinc protease
MLVRTISHRLLAAFVALACTITGPVLQHAGAQPADLSDQIQYVTSVEGISEYRLDNGLRVLLFPDESKQTITVNITYLVGSAHEQYGETGMAHLLEHLLFKGTPRHPNIPQELTERGAFPNGTTWLDRTNYFATFAATEDNLDWALDLEADRMINSFVSAEDLESEMTVVRNEFEMGENSPHRMLMQRMMSSAYVWHNYGNSTIGARSDIENVPIEKLQAFYRTYYQPDNAVLLVAGRFDEGVALDLIGKHFGPIPRPERVLPTFYTREPTQDGERTVVLRRTGDVQLVGAVYHVPSGAHEDFAAIDILNRILVDRPAGRLHKALVESGKATSTTGFNFQMREPGVAMFWAEVLKDAPLADAEAALIETLESFETNPPTDEEVERARSALMRTIDMALTQSDRVGLQLSESIAMGDWRLFFLHRDRIRDVSTGRVGEVAGRYFKPANRTLGRFIPTERPERAEIPQIAQADIEAMLDGYTGQEIAAAGEAFDPSPLAVEQRIQRQEAGDVKLALLPKRTRGNSVTAAITLRFGNPESLQNRGTSASLTQAMLMRGTTSMSRQEIRDELDRLRATVNVYGGSNAVTAYVETIRDNLPAVLKIVEEVLRNPSFPESELAELKNEYIASIEQQRSEPNAIAFHELNRHLSPYGPEDPRYIATVDERLERLRETTVDDVRSFHSDFYGASNATVAVVGDFEAEEVTALVAELLGGWSSPTPYERLVEVNHMPPVVSQTFETPDKANAVFIAGMNMPLRDDHADFPALRLGNFMLGGGFLNSRLATRIRQDDGLSYHVSSNLSADPLDEKGTFMTFAIAAPENVDRLEAAFRDEIERMLRDGFTEEEVAAAKNGFLQQRQVTRSQDGMLSRNLAYYLNLGRTFEWDADQEARIEALTAEDVNEAMRRHIRYEDLSIFKVGDFAKLESR